MTAMTIKEARRKQPVHPTHNQETWDANAIHEVEDTPWIRGGSLVMPPPRPGFDQRWVRVAVRGELDTTNTARKLREGWKPRPADSIPVGFSMPTISHGQFAGFLGVEGSVLCERPVAISKKRDAAMVAKNQKITASIESELQAQSDKRMAISQERRTTIGRMVKVADE